MQFSHNFIFLFQQYFILKEKTPQMGREEIHFILFNDEPHPFTQNYPFDFNAILNFVFKPDLEVDPSSKCRLGNGSGSELE